MIDNITTPILVKYDCAETDDERKARVKRGEPAETYSFMVVREEKKND